ncbi:LuxR family transcriptional regulator [Streptomyces sp. KL109B]|nr:LuxR family transcriptional regulator [Streptomyces sp. KL109B]
MDLCERRAELDQLSRMLAASATGRGQVAVVDAAPGMGKTALLHAFWDSLSDSDALVLSAGCVPTDHDLPLGLLWELLQSPGLDPAEVADGRRQLDAYAATLEDPSPAGERSAWVERTFARMVRQWSERRHVVICVDDVHHADPASLVQLSHLIRKVRHSRILVVLTSRTQSTKTFSPLHTLLSQPRVSFVRLCPLSPQGVRELADDLDAGPPGEEDPAADCHASTGGSPLLVQALLQDRARARQTGRQGIASVASALGYAVLSLLHSAGPETLAVARAMVLLAEPADISLISVLLALPQDTVRGAVSELYDMGLARGCRLRYAPARQVVLDDIPRDERGSWHRRSARLLFTSGAPAVAVAPHLAHTDDAPEPWMAKVLVDAADTVLDHDPAQAKAWLELARRLAATDPHQQTRITASLILAEMRLSPSAALRLLPRLFDARGEDSIAGRLPAELAWRLCLFGGAAYNQRLYDNVVRLADTDDPRVTIELGACRLGMVAAFPQLAKTLRDPLESTDDVALAMAPFTTTSQLQLYADLNSLLWFGISADAIENAEKVLSLTRLTDGTVRLLADAIRVLLGAERTNLAKGWADRLLQEASRRGVADWEAPMAALRAQAALLQGNLPDAERYARFALDRLPAETWGVSIGAPYATLLHALTGMGKHAEAADLLSRPVPEALFDCVYGLEYLCAKGHHYLATHQYKEGLRTFRACGQLMAQWGLRHSVVLPWRTGAAACLVALGSPGEARKLAREQLALVGRHSPSRLRGQALRALAATQTYRTRLALLGESAEIFQHNGNDLELARTLFQLSRARHRVGDTAKARMAARQALFKATECQASPLALRASTIAGATADRQRETVPAQVQREPERERERDGERDRERLRGLSGAERRVFDLVGQRLTNRQIAHRLFITSSTVEQHLTRIYRKLHVKGREGLLAWQRSPAVDPAPGTTAGQAAVGAP